MFGINFKPKSVARPIRTISQEVKATGAKYNEYLKTTKNDYIAQRGDVLMLGIAALGMFVGAAIGGTIDSHNNHNRAKEADKTAKV